MRADGFKNVLLDSWFWQSFQKTSSETYSEDVDPESAHRKPPDSARLCSLTCRYDNPIPTRFLAAIDCSKIPEQDSNISE